MLYIFSNKLIRKKKIINHIIYPKMKTILLLAIVCYAAFATQYVPIPKKEFGILIGNPTADVKLDLIYDPTCDGSY